jgi:hypothetical protein
MRAMTSAPILLAPIALAAAVATAAPPPAAHNLAIAHLGETVKLHDVRITPLRVLEDSRCPQDAACVWAGRVRLAVRIGNATRELALGEPVPIVGGTLQLSSVVPPRKRGLTIGPRDYRFGFRFDGNGAMQLIRD